MIIQHTLIDTFQTKLGEVKLNLFSSVHPKITTDGKTTSIETSGHLIEVISFDE